MPRPMTAGNPDRADFDAKRVAAQLRDQVELVDLGGGANILIIAQGVELGPAAAERQRAFEHAAVLLEAIPGDPGAVVEPGLDQDAEKIDQGAGQERVLE